MPKSKHSRLQIKIYDAINAVTEAEKIAYAFPELRCSFGGRSIVPDIVVLRRGQIEFDRPYSRPLTYSLLDRFTSNQHRFDRPCQANNFLPRGAIG
jgi:hypothetical protein